MENNILKQKTVKIRTALKDHKCDACGGAINEASDYVYDKKIYEDGTSETKHYHIDCAPYGVVERS